MKKKSVSFSPVWHSNSCFTSPESAFHTIARLSTDPESSKRGEEEAFELDCFAHFSEKIGPECRASERTSEPSAADQRRATPS